MRLENKVAVVTGAASGFGEAIARRFAQEGASVIVSDINDNAGRPVADDINAAGGTASYVRADVTNADDVAGMIAEEMGMDGTLARRAGLLHDIGKAADHDTEGGHPQIGADILKRYGEGPEVVHAALGHHDDIRVDMPYTVLVAAADACSASRPGARRETLDRYIKRMQELETIATSFEGVQQAFAIQAGREVRVIASTKHTTDESAAKICRDIAKAFEEQLTYPGEIKVTMIRESRFIETAR